MESDKDRIRARLRHGMGRDVPLTERKRRQEAARARRAGERKPRARGFDDDAPLREKLRSRRGNPRTPRRRTADLATPGAPSPAEPRREDAVAGERATSVAGVVGAVFGARCRVLAGGEEIVLAHPPRAAADEPLVVGDLVRCAPHGDGWRVVGREPRRTWLARKDPAGRARVLAANLDLALVTVAARRERTRLGLVDRVFVALAGGGVGAAVAVNKVDLLPLDGRAALAARLEPYRSLGVPVFEVSALTGEGIDDLKAAVRGRTLAVVGQSGAGKSSILNRLDSARTRRVAAVRAHDGKGRHATSASELVVLADGTRLIDTPGIRSFGLGPLTGADLAAAFPDVAAHASHCRFSDCRHDRESGCAVRAAAEGGALAAARYASWRRLFDDPA